MIFALYSSSLSVPYLFADETYAFSGYLVKQDVVSHFLTFGKKYGRPITGAAYAFFADLIVFGEYGLQGLRVLQFILSLAAAIVVFFIMQAIRIRPSHALLLTIFLWSQPAVAIYHAYFYLVPYWLGIFCSLFAFSIFLSRKNKPFGWHEGVIYFVLFVIGLCTFQMTPFFFLGFLVFEILNDRDESTLARYFKLFLVFLGTVAFYTVVFKIVHELFGFGGYEKTVNLLDSSDISRFFSNGYFFIFEFWNYLIPIEISMETKLGFLVITALLWVLLVVTALVVDIRQEKERFRRWLLALACAASSVLPIVADGASGRQHLFLAALPVLVLLAYYACKRLVPVSWCGRVKPILIVCLCLIVAGGSFGYRRALVEPAARLFTFVQIEAVNQMQPDVRKILVVRSKVGDMREICRYEPCTGFYGRRMASHWHLGQTALYQTALRLINLPPRLPVKFVTSDNRALRSDTIIIDWYRYLQFEKRRSK